MTNIPIPEGFKFISIEGYRYFGSFYDHHSLVYGDKETYGMRIDDQYRTFPQAEYPLNRLAVELETQITMYHYHSGHIPMPKTLDNVHITQSIWGAWQKHILWLDMNYDAQRQFDKGKLIENTYYRLIHANEVYIVVSINTDQQVEIRNIYNVTKLLNHNTLVSHSAFVQYLYPTSIVEVPK